MSQDDKIKDFLKNVLGQAEGKNRLNLWTSSRFNVCSSHFQIGCPRVKLKSSHWSSLMFIQKKFLNAGTLKLIPNRAIRIKTQTRSIQTIQHRPKSSRRFKVKSVLLWDKSPPLLVICRYWNVSAVLICSSTLWRKLTSRKTGTKPRTCRSKTAK